MSDTSEPVKVREVSASDLKNAWHSHLDRIAQGREQVIVTRYGRPVARLVPYEADGESPGLFGYLAGTVKEHGDIIAPTGEQWEVNG
ncbi:MAG: type II toxin-antitoxin system Phd/YefM family antitoxin [Gemmatimonadetes bacterium]|nr:type II toxin-antitoxin system Phd/YefM family antitoxin [Gemmatimonadota bacterium]